MLVCWQARALAEIYVIDTIGGENLQAIVQQQLNHLPNGGSVMVYQQRLIINTTPQNYQAIRQFIRQIDEVPQNLTVSVRVLNQKNSHQQTGGGQVVLNHQGVLLQGQWQNQQDEQTARQFFQITTQSGKPARINLSQLLPISVYSSYGYRPQIWLGQQLLTAEQGIDVTPTLLPDGQVSLKITQNNQKLTQSQGVPVVYGQDLSTTRVLGKNQWVSIGFISHQNTQNSQTGYRAIEQRLPIEVMIH